MLGLLRHLLEAAPEHTTAVLVRPPADASVRVAPVTLLGPLLVSFPARRFADLGVYVGEPSSLVIARSATGLTLSVSGAMELPRAEPDAPPGTASVAVLVTVPLVASTWAVTLIS